MPLGRAFTSIVIWLALCFAASAQTPDNADPAPLLARIASNIRDEIAKLPNYTCTMTIERAERVVNSRKLQKSDRVRLEVAMLGKKELYAWPGSRKFSDRPIEDIVPSGDFSTGEFGIFIDAIFLSGTAQFNYAGLEELNGRKVHHFIFMVPRARSRYLVVVPEGKGIAGYAGSAWCDAESLDLARLEIVIRETPPNLPVFAGRLVIDYAKTRVGLGDFLLPRAVDSTFTISGLENHDRTTFSGCHEYSAESAISFGEVPAREGPATANPSPVSIPAGIVIESKLETEFHHAQIATGDAFEATVIRASRHKGMVVVPKGAKIHGHVAAVIEPGETYECVGVQLRSDWIEFAAREGDFDAEQVVPLGPMGILRGPMSRCPLQPVPGSAMLVMKASHFASAGYPIAWRTFKPKTEK